MDMGVGARRELRSWGLGALGAIPLAAVLALGIALLPAGLERPVLVIASLSFWLFVWLKDRVPLFAIATWLVPALAVIGLALVVGSHELFYVTVLAVGVVVGLMSIYDFARRPWARYCSRIQRWIVARTLPPEDRSAHHALVQAMRLDANVRHAARHVADLAATARALRASAKRILAIQAPDEAWANVIRAAAEPALVYADMLGAKRPLDFDLIRELARQRDDEFIRLLEARSRVYGWLTYTAFSERRDK